MTLRASVSTAALCAVLFAAPVIAGPVGTIVFDPTNFGRNTITAAQAIQQTIRQATMVAQNIQQIQNQVQGLVNQGRMLAQLPQSIQQDIIGQVMQLENLMANARGIVMDYNQLQAQFDQVFATPNYQGWTGAQYAQSAQTIAQETLDAANNAMEAQGLVADLSQDRVALDTMLAASQGAQGQLGALQAANEISGLLVQNLMRLQTVVASSERAQTAHIAAQVRQGNDDEARWQQGTQQLQQTGQNVQFNPVNNPSFLNPIGLGQGN